MQLTERLRPPDLQLDLVLHELAQPRDVLLVHQTRVRRHKLQFKITFHPGLHRKLSRVGKSPLKRLRFFNNLREHLWVLPRRPDGDGGVVAARAEHALGPLLRVGVRDIAQRHVGLGLLCEFMFDTLHTKLPN